MLCLLRALSLLGLFIVLLSTGCGPLAAGDNLPGTYYRRGKGALGQVQEIRFTENKCTVFIPLAGEIAQAYTVKDGLVYVGGSDGQLIFRIDGPGVISNRGTLGYEGTYAKRAE